MEKYLPGVLIGLAVIVLVIRGQLRPTAVTARRTYLMPLILAAYGIGLVVVQDHGRFLDPAHEGAGAVLLVAELVAGVLLGLMRAATVQVWRDTHETVWRRGNGWTVAAWAVSILVRVAFVAGAGLLGVHSGTGLFIVFFAITLLAQNMIIERRGRTAPITATVQA